ncbi:phage integrase N-terminal SAM-like domain-containing protein [Nevskia ramosa]|uniref:phage integrase N-terminal SAM-like domain-containing protein n=1 Tax=Nevskia ramosa TaxID=64002 RepID=UPI003D140985
MAEPLKATSVRPPGSPRLLDKVRQQIRVRHYSLRTETAYVNWIRRFILFHGKRHPQEMGAPELSAFLSSLVIDRNVSANTQNQALAAILFLYKAVLEIDMPWLADVTRAKKPQRLPTVLTVEEVSRLLAALDGDPTETLVVRLLYGTGMRLLESLRLRVKDLDLARREIRVRDGKGGKDRVTMLPESLVEPMRARLSERRQIFEAEGWLLAGSEPCGSRHRYRGRLRIAANHGEPFWFCKCMRHNEKRPRSEFTDQGRIVRMVARGGIEPPTSAL